MMKKIRSIAVTKGWRQINIPGYWEDQGLHDLDGTVWYRRYIDVPATGKGNFSPQDQPAALYNAMLTPVTRYTIKGLLWYQGESNTSAPDTYARLQPALIKYWREKWGQGDLPFLFVQPPGFGDVRYAWADEPADPNLLNKEDLPASPFSVSE